MMTGKVAAQSISSLYMLPESFQGQMLNPAFMRHDKATVIAAPGFAGLTFKNWGNFKISDLIREQPNGKMAYDIEHFYNTGNTESSISESFTIPMVYVGIPFDKGRLSFYWKEQINTSLRFKTDAVEFFMHGNYPENFRSYNTEEANVKAFGYRELAVGYAYKPNKRLNVGIRGKLLFGLLLAEFDDWRIGIETAESGNEILFTSQGTGRFALPFPLSIENGKLQKLNSENATTKYFLSNYNPGLAIDLGLVYQINDYNEISFSATDIGGIWFWKNSIDIEQNTTHNFTGFELANSLDYNLNGEGYIDSKDVMFNTKDSIRNVFRLSGEKANYINLLIAKTTFHYQYYYSNKLMFGATNQTAFYKKNILNIFSIGSKQRAGKFSFFENINLHALDGVTVGGGVFWEDKFLQAILATDNVLAIYHPANQKSFTITAGVNIILNRSEPKEKSFGKISPYFPFYKIRRR